MASSLRVAGSGNQQQLCACSLAYPHRYHMSASNEPLKYEESFTAFVDFLGFSEASRNLDDAQRFKVLQLLLSLVELRSEFSAATAPQADGSKHHIIKPAISTFSDNIVISYDLGALGETMKDTQFVGVVVMNQLQRLISAIAAQALRLGFLVRGATTVGRLYHAHGVVFGEALVEAVQLEERTAIYPRIVLSSAVTERFGPHQAFVSREEDGISCIDYIRTMIFNLAPPGEAWPAAVKNWFEEVVGVIQAALETHARNGRLNELAKWTWFAKRFRAAVAAIPAEGIKSIGISVDVIPWAA